MGNTISRSFNNPKPYNFFNHMVNVKFWLLSGMFTVIWDMATKYLYSDVEFIKWFLLVFFLDLVTGTAKAWVNKELIVSKLLRRTIAKFIQYSAFLIMSHVLASFTVSGQNYMPLSWLPKVCATYAILVESKSVYENLQNINPEFNVKWVVSKLSDLIKAITTSNKK